MKAAAEKQCKATESQKTTVTNLRVKMLTGGKDWVIPALRSYGGKIDSTRRASTCARRSTTLA